MALAHRDVVDIADGETLAGIEARESLFIPHVVDVLVAGNAGSGIEPAGEGFHVREDLGERVGGEQRTT